MANFFQRVYEAVKKIPKGKVCTYGVIAFMAGSPRASRVVGYALHHNPDPENIPCHRVVNCHGKLAPSFAFGGEQIQKKLLESEGVKVSDDGYVDLKTYMDWL
ncbi:MAG: MGMT family protein [Clostridiales bacterium]|nr:MGMT family protein [Clostridiales bacterium]